MISVLVSPAAGVRDLVVAFERIAARVITWPEIKISPPGNYSALDEAIENLFGYDWLILKNVNAARFFLRRFEELNHHPAELDELRLCAIGEPTVELIREAQIHLDVEVEQTSFHNIFGAIRRYIANNDSLAGLNFLLPTANVNREALAEQLQETGARVDIVTSYQTVSDPQSLAQLNALLVGGGVDYIVFGSEADIAEFAQLFDTNDLAPLLREVAVITMDESSKRAARKFRFTGMIAPTEPTTSALVNLIARR